MTAVAAMCWRATDGFAAIACSAAADRCPQAVRRPDPLLGNRRLGELVCGRVHSLDQVGETGKPNRTTASKTKTNMANTAAGIVGGLDSSPTAPAQMAASIAARRAATNHDAATEPSARPALPATPDVPSPRRTR